MMKKFRNWMLAKKPLHRFLIVFVLNVVIFGLIILGVYLITGDHSWLNKSLAWAIVYSALLSFWSIGNKNFVEGDKAKKGG